MAKSLRATCVLLALIGGTIAIPAIAGPSISSPPPVGVPPRDGDAEGEPVDPGQVGPDGGAVTADPSAGDGATFIDGAPGETAGEPATSGRGEGRRSRDRRLRRELPPVDPDALRRFDDRLGRDIADVEAREPDPDRTRRAVDALDDRQGYVFDPGPARSREPATRVPTPVGSGEVDIECSKEKQSLRNEIDGKQDQIKALLDLIETLKAKAKKLESEAHKLESADHDTSGRPLTAAELLSNQDKFAALFDQIQMINAQIDGAYDQIQALKEEIMALESVIADLDGCRTG